MRTAWVLVIVSALDLWIASPSYGEPGPIGRWLMNEPVTLWTGEFVRLRKEANEAAEIVGKDIGTSVSAARTTTGITTKSTYG